MSIRTKLVRLAVAIGLGSSIAGCSTLTGGNDEFSCSGQPEGVRCMSAREVYQQTENPGPVRIAEVRKEREAKSRRETEREQTVPAAPHSASRAVELPRSQDPLPVRTTPKIMRIWIAPWEDDNGDLIGNGIVYTEIEERRWNVGIGKPPREQRLHPLRVQRTSDSNDG